MIDPKLIDALPPAARRAFAAVYPSEPATQETLSNRIRDYTAEIGDAARRNEFVDVTLSSAIVERLVRLLSEWDALAASERAIVHAAVEYYLLRDDAEDDLDSVLGFEDDARVLNACLHH